LLLAPDMILYLLPMIVLLIISVTLFMLSITTKKIIIREDTIRIVRLLGTSKSRPIGELIYYDHPKGQFLINGYLLDARRFSNRDDLAETFSQYSTGRNITYHVNLYNDYKISKVSLLKIIPFFAGIIGLFMIRYINPDRETGISDGNRSTSMLGHEHNSLLFLYADAFNLDPMISYILAAVLMLLM
jgi:hypothetical protein